MEPLTDSWNREIRSVRVSVTDKCNFRCRYCMPAEGLEWLPRDEVLSFEEIARIVAVLARMGVDELSVLDPLTMRVHGLDGLRVVDASAMPYVTNGNIYAPVMMLAEKAADLVAGNEPLPPQTTPFYRHGVSPLEDPSRIAAD